MQSWFILKHTTEATSKPEDNVRFPIELPKKFIQEYTKPGDIVLDPFAGFGTTVLAAQALGRIGVGIEYEQSRVDGVASQLVAPNRIIRGDARKLSNFDLPLCDFSFTSPPYMRSFDTENPLTNYHEAGNYNLYLQQIHEVYQQLRNIMKPDARVVIEIENTYEEGKPVTPLAWDVAEVISKLFFFEKDFVACHEADNQHKTDHSYVLVFKN